MRKLIDRIKHFLQLLPFGLKGADAEIMGNANVNGTNGTTINQQVNDKRVAKHLLKGEVTEEVSELRYRTYKVNRESEKYDYVGNGMAVKKKIKRNKSTIKFTQENKPICNDLYTEFKRVNGYGEESYHIKVEYLAPVRYKIEKFITSVDVLIKNGNKAKTTLRFNDIPDPTIFESKIVIKELNNLVELFEKNDVYGISRNVLSDSVSNLNFVTYNASNNEPNLISYCFITPKLVEAKHLKGEFLIVYEWEEYTREDLTNKFFNQNLEDKYKRKEKKNISTDMIIDELAKLKCSVCGRELNPLTDEFSFDCKSDKITCVECLKKALLDKK